MSLPADNLFKVGACALDVIIATGELDRRPRRAPDTAAETQAVLKLQRDLAISPDRFFQKLVDAARALSGAESTGISLVNDPEACFVWPAVSGPFNVYLGGGTPRNFGPCGTVLERDETLLMQHPERHFAYLEPIQPGLEEVLLVPFYVDGKAVGTIWAVLHTPGLKFDAEDRRLLEDLSAFAGSAYQALVRTGRLEPLLRPKVSRAL